MNYVYIKLPRFDGRKTLAFNGAVFIAASGWLTAAYTGLTGFGPVGETGLHALAAVAALNGLLRLVTERPVWWRQMCWYGVDLASGESETVYTRAAEFVERSDFTDVKLRDRPEYDFDRYRRELDTRLREAQGIAYGDVQRDLDKRLSDTREAFDGQFCGHSQLPLDADERAN